MAVRWRSRRPAPAPADDGRWGVARLVAEREADRLARQQGPTAPPAPVEPATPSDGSGSGSGSGERRDLPSEGDAHLAREPDVDGPTQRTLTAVRRRRPGPAAIPTPQDDPAPQGDADGSGPAAVATPDDAAAADDSVPGSRRPVTAPPSSPVPPAPRRSPTGPVPRLPAPRRPRATGDDPAGVVYRPPAVSARPPVDLDNGLLGFSRMTRGRIGARVFTIVFVLIYLVILVQTLSTIV
ncbi:hypothetical protein [Pseudonocardia sp. ICBG1293]|uniref:hypothetical protein n=1 Tax=Pseudonocardia sp. ICBG1293 TaxID=2844382 RepID=UPI001CCE4BFD|nr:hypothetical protein [Pseudonocardia sp. ICBG1293]